LSNHPTPTAKDNQPSANPLTFDPSLIERADGDLVEEVEMDPHIERRRWIVGRIRAEDHP
jgi:hypothetical protein